MNLEKFVADIRCLEAGHMVAVTTKSDSSVEIVIAHVCKDGAIFSVCGCGNHVREMPPLEDLFGLVQSYEIDRDNRVAQEKAKPFADLIYPDHPQFELVQRSIAAQSLQLPEDGLTDIVGILGAIFGSAKGFDLSVPN